MSDGPNSKGGPPPIERAVSVTPLTDRGLIDRMVDAVRNVVSPARPPVDQGGVGQSWFGPGEPIAPIAPKEDVAGRQFDYPTAFNLTAKPRSYEAVNFAQLRLLADNWDMLRLAIETRKDQMAKLEWSILPRKRPDENFRRRADDRCQKVETFFRKPDRLHHWTDWVRMLVEDQLVIDAPSIYLRRDMEGKPWALEPVDGATLTPMIDGSGRRPIPPDPAFQQVLKGVVAAEYTSDEMLYFPRNPRTWKVYGMSPTEQIVMTINIGLRRMTKQLETYTTGNVPDALIGVPETWTSQQIQEYQRYWDSLMESPSQKRKAKFVPGNLLFQPTHTESEQMSPFDEWLARVVCYAFSLPPLPFVRMMNRATAQTSYESALEEGLAPMMMWLKNAVDDMISHWFGEPDLELVWDNIRKLDQSEQAQLNLQLIRAGVKSLDEVRAEMGLEPLGLGHVIFGPGPLGYISPGAMQRSIQMGLDMPQPPMMPPDAIDPATGQPLPGADAMMGGGDPMSQLLADVPPDLLEAVGLDQMGNVTGTGVQDEDIQQFNEDDPFGDDAEANDSLTAGALHPEVARTLKETESRLGARGQ